MRLIALLVWLSLTGTVALAECSDTRIALRGPWGQAGFAVEIADTNASRARGLMFRETLPRFSGMLFVYDRPHRARFWMKNTLIPLDMIFLDQHGVVVSVHPMAEPHSLEPIDGGSGVLVVLEINGGLAETLGIAIGSEASHPAFGEDAQWVCE